jgi:hypothetical protein
VREELFGHIDDFLAQKLLQDFETIVFCQSATQYEELPHALERSIVVSSTLDYRKVRNM